jgi:hypothetical protein
MDATSVLHTVILQQSKSEYRAYSAYERGAEGAYLEFGMTVYPS